MGGEIYNAIAYGFSSDILFNDEFLTNNTDIEITIDPISSYPVYCVCVKPDIINITEMNEYIQHKETTKPQLIQLLNTYAAIKSKKFGTSFVPHWRIVWTGDFASFHSKDAQSAAQSSLIPAQVGGDVNENICKIKYEYMEHELDKDYERMLQCFQCLV
jgi:hypothetical protein